MAENQVVDNQLVERQLAELLGELSQVQDELLEVLAVKRERIAGNHLSAAAELQPRTEDLCDRLQACHAKRAELLATAEVEGRPPKILGDLAASLNPRGIGKLPNQVKEVSSKVRLLQHSSLTNWVLAQRSILHLSQLLEIIATGGQLQPTYGRDDKVHASTGGAIVDHEA